MWCDILRSCRSGLHHRPESWGGGAGRCSNAGSSRSRDLVSSARRAVQYLGEAALGRRWYDEMLLLGWRHQMVGDVIAIYNVIDCVPVVTSYRSKWCHLITSDVIGSCQQHFRYIAKPCRCYEKPFAHIMWKSCYVMSSSDDSTFHHQRLDWVFSHIFVQPSTHKITIENRNIMLWCTTGQMEETELWDHSAALS